jgi:hypothetical protein
MKAAKHLLITGTDERKEKEESEDLLVSACWIVCPVMRLVRDEVVGYSDIHIYTYPVLLRSCPTLQAIWRVFILGGINLTVEKSLLECSVPLTLVE